MAKIKEIPKNQAFLGIFLWLQFEFSGNRLEKSINSQMKMKKPLIKIAKLLHDFDNIIESSTPIEIHTDYYKDTLREDKTLKKVYVLLGGFIDENALNPVQFEIKEYADKENKLYLVITLNEIEKASVMGQALSKDNPKSWDAFEVSILDIIKNVKSSDGAFLKYIPDELLTDEQKSFKKEALDAFNAKIESLKKGERSARFSEKVEDSRYKLIGENERLAKQNKKLAQDVKDLKELVRLSYQKTNGKVWKPTELTTAANSLLKIVDSNMSKNLTQ